MAATLALVIALGIIWSLRQTARSTSQTNQAVEAMRQEIETMEKIRDAEAQKAQVSTASSTKEKIIRDQLLRQKPDETILQLPALPVNTPTPALPTPTDSPLRLWQNKFFLR